MRHVHPDAPGFGRAVRGFGALAIALTLTAGTIAAGAAPTTTAPTAPPTTAPPTTAPPTPVPILPPPRPFPLGDDFGRFLKVHRIEAQTALAASTADVARYAQLVALGTDHVKVATRVLAYAQVHAHEVALQLVAIHEQIKVMAVDAYMLGSSVQITGALSSFESAKDVVGLARNITLVNSSHDRLLELVDLARREQWRAARQVRTAVKARVKAMHDWLGAQASLADAQRRNAEARAALDRAVHDYTRFFELATTSASPIMGPSRLTGDDLVAYLDSLGVHPHLTVPIRTLAEMFISEGEAEGVRGDVAFAQSILETGAFMYPGHGLVDPTDNNYAGIDACDSCKHGDLFSSALIGVRAQIQLLRVYSDPSLKKISDLAHPLALLHEPRLGFSGHVKTWYALGGRWATGPNYGFHVYDIYMQMVALAR